MGKIINEIGNVYGRLTVISRADSVKWGQALWNCRCDCGNITVVCGNSLRRGATMGCGCKRGGTNRIEETGNRHGKLLVIEHVDCTGGQARWLCRCDCGSTVVVIANNFRRGVSPSCGLCSKLEPEEASLKNLYSMYKASAKKRGLVFDIDLEIFRHLTSQNCHYCGAEPLQVHRTQRDNSIYVYNGLDRVDNEVGYLESNVVSCCGICNRAKHKRSYKEFMEWIARLVDFRAHSQK